MSDLTTNYELKKRYLGHPVRDDDIADNLDTIDAQMYASALLIASAFNEIDELKEKNEMIDILSEKGKIWTDTGTDIVGETYIYSLAYLGNGIVIAGTGSNAEIWRSTDYGVTWTDTGADIVGETYILSLVYLGNGIVIAGTASNAEIWRSTDYGVTWTDTGADIVGEAHIRSLAYSGNGIVIAGTGSNAEIWRSESVWDHAFEDYQ